MTGIALADHLVIGMACDHIIKLKLNPFQAGRPGMDPHQVIIKQRRKIVELGLNDGIDKPTLLNLPVGVGDIPH